MSATLFWSASQGRVGAWVATEKTPGGYKRTILKGVDENDRPGAERKLRAEKAREHLANPIAALEATIAACADD